MDVIDTHTAPPRSRATVDDVLRVFDLDRLADGRWQGSSVAVEATVVFAGQLIGQAMVAATAEAPGKRVKSVHSTFARVGRTDQPLTFDVDTMHDGRSMAGVTVTASQGDRRLARSVLLLDTADDDLIRHASEVPEVAGPGSAHPQTTSVDGWDQRFVEDVDLFDPTAVGPPELRIWSRFATDRTEPVLARALLGWASIGSFIGVAMRPHEGMGLARAHKDVSTGVLSHTLTFHAEFAPGEWLLYALRSPFAGGGKAFGAGEVFTADGRLVASCSQESMIRPMVGGSRL